MELGNIDWNAVIGNGFGGLVLFLYGMKQMGDALKQSAGTQMKTILSTLSLNQVVGLFTGFFACAILQSSAMISIMLVNFVSSGLMNLDQTMGINLGAGIGTTLTSQIQALDITKYALYFVILGFAINSFGKDSLVKIGGIGVFGFGLSFFGMQVMSDALVPLKNSPTFIDLLVKMSNPILGILASLVFTAIIQSSTATVSIIIVLASKKLITLQAGISLVLGANIGTSLVPLLAAVGSSRDAWRVAVSGILFKLVGVIVILPFLGFFTYIVEAISPSVLTRQIANAHTLFNVFVAIFFLPLTNQVSKLVTKIIPNERKFDHSLEVIP